MPRPPENALYAYLDTLRPPAIQGDTVDLDPRLKRIEDRLSALERRHKPPQTDRRPWITRVLMKGISPSTENFVQSETQLSPFRAAGYASVADIARQRPEGGKDPAQVIHERCLAAYSADPDNVAPPPDLEEVRMFYEICREHMDEKGASS